MVRIFSKFGTPKPHNLVTTSRHIGVLGFIEPLSFLLSSVQLRELFRMTVPVVAVKLNDDSGRWDKGINTEFVTNEILRGILNPQAIKDIIADNLYFGRCLFDLLEAIHIDEHNTSGGVGVAARKRTIGNIIPLIPGGRPSKVNPANLTSVSDLVSALPLDLMIQVTEIMLRTPYPVLGYVYRLTAPAAREFLARFSGCKTTLFRAKPLTGRCCWLKFLAANLAISLWVSGEIRSALDGAKLAPSPSRLVRRPLIIFEITTAILANLIYYNHTYIIPRLNRYAKLDTCP